MSNIYLYLGGLKARELYLLSPLIKWGVGFLNFGFADSMSGLWVRGFAVQAARSRSLNIGWCLLLCQAFQALGLGNTKVSSYYLEAPGFRVVGQGDVFREDLRFRFWAGGFGGYGLASGDCFFSAYPCDASLEP